jgi:hypothetical protein
VSEGGGRVVCGPKTRAAGWDMAAASVSMSNETLESTEKIVERTKERRAREVVNEKEKEKDLC